MAAGDKTVKDLGYLSKNQGMAVATPCHTGSSTPAYEGDGFGGAGTVFVARVGSDEQMRTKEQRGGVVVIIFELLLAHLEDEKERSQLLGLLAWWRVEGEDKSEVGKPARE